MINYGDLGKDRYEKIINDILKSKMIEKSHSGESERTPKKPFKVDISEIDEEIRVLGDIPLKRHEIRPLSIIKPDYSSEKIEKIEKQHQKHLLFCECENYLDFYERIDGYYDDSEKYLVEGKAHWVSRKDIVQSISFLNYHGIGEFQIKNDMPYYKHVDVKKIMGEKRFLCLSGATDSQKTTKLISMILSILTEKKQDNKYYNVDSNLLIVWDDVMSFDFWKKNSQILLRSYEYIFIDDMFNRELGEWQKDNLITLLRNAEKNGSKIIITTNADNQIFFEEIERMGESLYSRFNKNRFKFIKMDQKNYRNQGNQYGFNKR